jgi:hypothetical protein
MFVIDAVARTEEDVVIQFARAGKEAEIVAASLAKKNQGMPGMTIITPMGIMKQPTQGEQDRAKWQFGIRITAEEYESLGSPGVGAVFNLGWVVMPREA